MQGVHGLLAVALSLVAFSIGPRPALAQSAPDAGANRHAASGTDAPPGAANERPAAPVLKSIPNANNVLSERVRARLQERAAGRHPSELGAHEAAAEHPSEPAAQPLVSAAPPAVQSAREHASSEALRRGAAHQRRVLALDTGDGITVLSNRMGNLSAPPLAAVRPSRAEAEHSEEVTPEQHAALDEATVTETRSLRALSSRREVPKAREGNLGIGWLLWPFVLLLATGAVVGTLWFSKKTE